jgi:hypothetical protein
LTRQHSDWTRFEEDLDYGHHAVENTLDGLDGSSAQAIVCLLKRKTRMNAKLNESLIFRLPAVMGLLVRQMEAAEVH